MTNQTKEADTLSGRITKLSLGETYFMGERIAFERGLPSQLADALKYYNGRAGPLVARAKAAMKGREYKTESIKTMAHDGSAVFVLIGITRTA